jgi:hypothetical protein
LIEVPSQPDSQSTRSVHLSLLWVHEIDLIERLRISVLQLELKPPLEVIIQIKEVLLSSEWTLECKFIEILDDWSNLFCFDEIEDDHDHDYISIDVLIDAAAVDLPLEPKLGQDGKRLDIGTHSVEAEDLATVDAVGFVDVDVETCSIVVCVFDEAVVYVLVLYLQVGDDAWLDLECILDALLDLLELLGFARVDSFCYGVAEDS